MLWIEPYYDCDTEFRFYWASVKLGENPEVTMSSARNPYPFKLLPNYPCDKESLTAALASKPDLFGEVQTDGLLFYHKKLHYIPGHTPLVGWLKPFMVRCLLKRF